MRINKRTKRQTNITKEQAIQMYQSYYSSNNIVPNLTDPEPTARDQYIMFVQDFVPFLWSLVK